MQDNKTLIAIVAVVIVAAGAYYLFAGSAEAPIATEAEVSASADALPVATDSVDDFAAAMRADTDATAAALQAFDAELSDAVTNVQTAGDATNLYDPENI